jgi:hypothetical protein
MFVEVLVHVDMPGRLVSIPEEAQRPSGEVWVVRDGRLVMLKPRPLQAAGGRVVYDAIQAGLEPGDRVVTSQIAQPRAGMEVVEANGPRTGPAVMAEGPAGTDPS